MNKFDFDVNADGEYTVSDGENFEGTKAGWSSQVLTAAENHDDYEVIVEYHNWVGNDINTRGDEGFLIGVTEDGKIHRWERDNGNLERGPDYGKLEVDSKDPLESIVKDEYEWSETADQPSYHTVEEDEGERIKDPEQVVQNYLEDRVSLSTEDLFN